MNGLAFLRVLLWMLAAALVLNAITATLAYGTGGLLGVAGLLLATGLLLTGERFRRWTR